MERKRRTTRTLRPKSPSFPAMSTTTITDTNQAARTFLAGDEARIDGDIKVRGEAIYTADISREGMLWAAFAESPYPHAKIVSIDKAAALAVPGVGSADSARLPEGEIPPAPPEHPHHAPISREIWVIGLIAVIVIVLLFFGMVL